MHTGSRAVWHHMAVSKGQPCSTLVPAGMSLIALNGVADPSGAANARQAAAFAA